MKRQIAVLGILVVTTLCLTFWLTLLPPSAYASELAFVVPNPQADSLSGDAFVALPDVIPGIVISLKYASADNITGKRLYDFSQAFLRLGPALKLAQANTKAEQLGYKIEVWDAYRPPAAQFELWRALPDPRYIANPYIGYSRHSNGTALDVTLTDLNGNELIMPSRHDEAGSQAHRNYNDDTPEVAARAQLLEIIMYESGFTGLQDEWWHFQDNSYPYPVVDLHIPVALNLRYKEQGMQIAAFIVDGRTLVPARAVADLLDMSISWDFLSQQVLMEANHKIIALRPDSLVALVNGDEIILPTAARLIGRTNYVPIRMLAELIGHSFSWDQETQSITINQ